jgi:hypothetical protein
MFYSMIVSARGQALPLGYGPPRIGRFRSWLVAAAALAFVVPDLHAQVAYDAAYVSEVVPSFVQFQTPAPASVTMRNTGTATWYQAQGDVFLATQEPQDNYYWCIQGNRYGSHSGNRVLLPYDVAPGQDVTFNFVVSPLSCFFAATSPFRFRMLSQLHGTFGEETPDPNIVVSNAAVFVAQQVPAIVPAGASIQVSATFQNTTNITWLPTEGYVLASAAPNGNTAWGVSSVPLPMAVAAGASVTFEFSVVAPTTVGTYNFQWQMNFPAGVPFGLISPATPVEVVAAGPPNYGGLWWNSPAGSESGWGLNLAHQGSVIFATWFTYDQTGRGRWLAMTADASLSVTTPNVYTGTLYQSNGPAFDTVPFDPSQVNNVSLGTGTLTFTDANDGTFAYIVNGISQTKNITREVFGPLPTCTFAILTDLTQAYNYQDIWWAAPAGVEAGWGINFTHQGDTIFATWFTYDVDRTPIWFVATAPKTAAGVYSGTLYQTTGPAFNAVPFNPTAVTATAVGTATFTFTDGNDATFAYTVNGVSQTKPITREILQSPGTVCQ